ncbi:MAG: DUF3298 domain-containing protein [Bacteroidales bacterium]|nr:DUF3298 domain-containing protein [Bacteroidales bacterium]
MKKYLFYILTISALMAGCHQGGKQESAAFSTHQLEGKRCFVLIGTEAFPLAGTVIGLENSYRLAWPDEGLLSSEAEAALIAKCFGDSASSTLAEATEKMLYCTWGYEEYQSDLQMLELRTDSIADTLPYTYGHVESTCEVEGGLATFIIQDEIYSVGAAHGLYSMKYLTVDINTGNVLELSDLLDTVGLGDIIRMAVEELEDNASVREDVFDEFLEAGAFPMPHDFFIDNDLRAIIAVYQPYEVASYACGIQNVTLNADWLARHVQFTPKGKQLFGLEDGSSVAEAKRQ